MDQFCRSPQQLGVILRRYRKQLKLTQSQVSEIANVRQATITSVERSEINTKVSTIFNVLFALDLEMVIRPRVKVPLKDLIDKL